MYVIIFILTSSIIALLVDWYIYKRVIKRHPKLRRYWRVGYLVYAFTVDIAVIVAFTCYWVASDSSPGKLKVVMWVLAFFFLHYIPKLVYVVISWGDYLVQKRRKKRGNNKISHWFGYSAVLLSVVAGLVMLHSITYGRTRVRVERVELHYADLPEAFDGFTIAQFSDLHLGTLAGGERIVARMVDSINRLSPDIIVHSGDIVNSHSRELNEQMVELLSRMKSREGIYGTVGNHDTGMYIRDTIKYPPKENMQEVLARQRAMGWKVLQDSTLYIRRGDDSIALSGLNFPFDKHLQGDASRIEDIDFERVYGDVPSSMFNITISHSPELWDDILENHYANLTVAGHIHAMQSIINIGKWRISPARLMHKRWSGLYEDQGRYLYINDGVGCVMFHLRVGVKPEITLFTLKRTKT